MVSTSAIDLCHYPQELIAFATNEAGRDAIDLGDFLAAAGLAPPPGETRGIPKGILLDLGAVVRLRRWEAAGYSIHLDAGLPSAREALGGVIRTLIIAAEKPAVLALAGALGRAVFDLMITRFAWAARIELGADVALDTQNDDALVEAMAQFLWAHRHHIPVTE
ncbi:MAG: hypothetical protein K8U57_23725 [Planctomycetes bacterium]|nr:hypothetical protein [Planctomycetota bacterium]